MATETKKIIVRKGLSAQLPDLDEGEPGFTTDTQKLYVGTSGTANIELSKEGHTHVISNVNNLQTTLDGKAASVHTHAISEVTNLQTALDAKAATSHTHVISNVTNLQTSLDAKQNAATALNTSTSFSGDISGTYNAIVVANDSHNHTLSTITNAGTIASVNLNGNGAQFLKGDGTFGIPTVAAGSAEWSYIGGTTVSSGTIIVDSSVIGGSFDLATYDYKFVTVVETNDEDNSNIFIRINNISSVSYKWVFTRASGASIGSDVFSDSNGTLIQTGIVLPSDNDGIAYTNVELEFILSRSYTPFVVFGTPSHNYIIKGQGIASAMTAPVAGAIVYPLTSNFVGTIQNSTDVNTLEIIHDITAGATDTSKVRVYRRAK